MENNLTPKQKINAELMARSSNQASFEKLKHHTPVVEQPGLKIAFNCECSDVTCSTRIFITLPEYEQLHDNFARFVVADGHNEPTIEQITHKLTSNNQDLVVVEKYALNNS